jgi:hypothetical protein
MMSRRIVPFAMCGREFKTPVPTTYIEQDDVEFLWSKFEGDQGAVNDEGTFIALLAPSAVLEEDDIQVLKPEVAAIVRWAIENRTNLSIEYW